MKKMIKLGLIVVLAGLVLVSASACGKADKIEPQFFEVTRADLMITVSADGNLSLPRHRKLTFGIPGTIAKINVEEGDKVTKGQVLASLDATSLELAVKTAEQAVKTAEIDLEMATDDYRKITYPYDFRTWTLDVPASVVLIGNAQRELAGAVEVMQELGQRQEQYSWEQYWDVWDSLKQAQDDLVRARETLIRGYGEDVFASGIVPMRDFWTLRAAQLEMDKAQLALDNVKNDLERPENDLKKAVIIAPIAGVMAHIDVT